jgi:aminopeptidase N
LTPDLEAFTFAGTCEITFTVDATKLNDENSKEITLHAKELCFASAEYIVLDDTTSTPVPADEILVNVKATTVKFVFGHGIPRTAAKIKMSIKYNGFLNNQMAGFYRSGYTDIAGKAKIMASTQFESLDARRCLPCVDEPAAKAVFAVALTVDAHLQVLSNMPVASYQTLSTSAKKVSFLDTPIMSTYLLAICVGEFDCLQTVTQHGVIVSVYTPPGKSHMGDFALSVAARALDAYDDFFQIHFPLPKLDMIAIPEFAMGAMEVSCS